MVTTLKPEFICYRPSLGATEGITEASRASILKCCPAVPLWLPCGLPVNNSPAGLKYGLVLMGFLSSHPPPGG